MDPDYEGSDVEEQEEELAKPPVDYEKLDQESGFKLMEYQAWQEYQKKYLDVPEDEREGGEPADWATTYAEENNLDPNRMQMVVRLGLYAGDRDEFNQRTGEGRTIHANRDTYNGQYWEGKRNGKGTYVYVNKGISEIGKHIKQLQKNWTGSGSASDSNNEDFIVHAASTLRIGDKIVRAALTHGFHPVYNGTFTTDMRDGFGLMIYANGSIYEGQWKHDKPHGEGVYHYLNGDMYEGQWEESTKTGSGRYTFAKGKGMYAGVWVKNVFTEGQWEMANGVIYEGKFDQKSQPCDTAAAIKFPGLEIVSTGAFGAGQWQPTKNLYTTTDYNHLVEASAASAAGEEVGEE